MIAGLATVGLTLFNMWGQSQVAKAQAEGQIAMLKGQREVNRAKMREANENNKLAQHLQNIGNNRILAAAAKTRDAANTNRFRVQEAAVSQGIEAGLQQSEQAGAYAANVASKQIGGTAVGMIDMALALRNSRANFLRDRNNAYMDYDAAKQVAGIMPTSLQAIDQGVRSMGIDTTIVAPEVRPGTNWIGAILGAGGGKAIDNWLGTTMSTQAPSTGTGVRLGGGGIGVSSPSTGFWNTGSSSLLKLD